uniref:Uncharacterized protein n=1 Tax=Erpetoichthys calabaricus TaxID=27687 RepID=A0A8C4SRA9_ERPCA
DGQTSMAAGLFCSQFLFHFLLLLIDSFFLSVCLRRHFPKNKDSSQESADLESLLNETASQLKVLRQKVQSEPLGLKITALEEAARRQDVQIRQVEQDIVEILEEKLSLEDIVRNVPSGCTKTPQ